MVLKKDEEPLKIIGLKYTPAGILKRVSENAYVMAIDFSEPTGEDYFRTDPKYYQLPPAPVSKPRPEQSAKHRKAARPANLVQVSENVWTMHL